MAADSSDKLRKYARKWVGQIGSGGVADASVTTIPLASASNLPTDTAVDVVINRVDANGVKTPSSEETVTGVVSGNNLVDCVRGVEGTAQAHDAGSVAEVLVTAARENDMVDWGLAEHNQSGAHTTDSIAEKTAATGVTIDSLLIKDGRVAGWDCWMPAEETWTRASASTITVPAGATAKYQKGDKIRLKQSGDWKYFYVIGVADTVLTVTGGNDYTLADAAITDNYYSKVENPQGFPDWFNYTPTYSCAGSMTYTSVSTNYAKFKVSGKMVTVVLRAIGTTGGAGSNTIYASVPIAQNATLSSQNVCAGGVEVGDTTGIAGHCFHTSGSIGFRKYDTTNWGLGSGRLISGVFNYQMA